MSMVLRTIPKLSAGIVAICAVLGLRSLSIAETSNLVSCETGLAASVPFVPSCRIEPMGQDIHDPEFNRSDLLVTWRVDPLLNQDGSVKTHGSIAIAPIGEHDGAIISAQTIYVKAQPVHNRFIINGPEWSDSQRGREIYYTCYTKNELNVQICRISRDASGVWRNSVMPGTASRSSRNASLFAGDPVPKIMYEIHSGTITQLNPIGYGFRFDTAGGHADSKEWGRDFGQGRWLPDGSGIIHMQVPPRNSERRQPQPSIYDIASGLDRSLLSDEVRRGDPWPWFPPEWPGRMAFMVAAEDPATGAHNIEVYQQTSDNQWIPSTTIASVCSEFPVNFSAEPFVHENRSFVSVVSFRDQARESDSIVWIATVDPSLPAGEQVHRSVSEASCGVRTTRRNDPEIITRNGRVDRVYFTDFGPGIPYPSSAVVPVTADIDGDGRVDLGRYAADLGQWVWLQSTFGFLENQFGHAGTLPVTGDFDGDGRSDFGVFYAPLGKWYLMKSTEGFFETQFGYEGTVPVVGDFDGDGRSDFGVYYAPLGSWHLMKSTEGYFETQFGYEGTRPVLGDFDGDGRSDFGVYHAAVGKWYILKSTAGFFEMQFGYEGTVPVVGDFDGDGRSDFGVYYAPLGTWYLLKSTEGFFEMQFGYEGTRPVLGDFDGDGRSDFGVTDPLSGDWFLYESREEFSLFNF